MANRTDGVTLLRIELTAEDWAKARANASWQNAKAGHADAILDLMCRERQLADSLATIDRQSKLILALQVTPTLQDAREQVELAKQLHPGEHLARIAGGYAALRWQENDEDGNMRVPGSFRRLAPIDYHANQSALLSVQQEMDGEVGR